MTREITFPVKPADPAMAILVLGYYANLPRYEVEHIWQYEGQHYCSVAPKGRDAFTPPDSTIYRVEEAERNVRGEDVECLSFKEVGFYDGSKGRVVWSEDELAPMEAAL